MPSTQPHPADVALPGDAPSGPRKPVTMTADRADDIRSRLLSFDQTTAELRGQIDELRARLEESRRQTDRAIAEHANDRERLRQKHDHEIDVLESILYSLNRDWDSEFNCPACEEQYARPDHALCDECESRVEAEAEERGMRLAEDRS